MSEEPPLPIYWWLDTGKHLFRRFHDPKPTGDWKLDPVKVAGRLNIERLKDLAQELMNEEKCPVWGQDVVGRLTATCEDEFCKTREVVIEGTSPGHIARRTIPKSRQWMLEDMKKWNMIEPYPSHHTDIFRYVGLFAVLKACGLLFRIIFDCRMRNLSLEPPPRLELASIKSIFWTIAYFEFFATFDLRHYFYQIGIPEAARNMILLACGDNVFRSKVLSMGIHIAPWIAENVAALIVVLAAERAGLVVSNVELHSDTAPGYLDIADKSGNLVCRVIIWLDNFLIATATEKIRKAILVALLQHDQGTPGSAGILVQLRLVVKNGSYDPDTFETPTEENVFKGVKISERHVEYMNVYFERKGPRTVMWRHTEVERWEKIRSVPLGATHRYWACLAGILLWSWQLSGEDKGSIAAVIDLSSKIGGTEDFDSPYVLDGNTQKDLQILVDELFRNETKIREIAQLPRKVFFASSDASKKAGAGVRWNRNRTRASLCFGPTAWSEAEAAEDINVRETMAAARTISTMLDEDHNALLLIGTDNVTARAAIHHGLYPGHQQLTKELRRMKEKARERQCVIHIVHLPGKIMAADAPSRLAELDQDMCNATKDFLEKIWQALLLNEKRMNGSINKRKYLGTSLRKREIEQNFIFVTRK